MIRAKKYKPRKAPKMDLFRKRASDYSADHAYREAVTKLKYLLADSYTPVTVHKFTPGVYRGSHHLHHHHHHCTFDTPTVPSTTTTDKPTPLQFEQVKQRSLQLLPKRPETTADTPPEFMSFMRRQEDYIEQLEKESHYCREEVANMLEKVRDVMAENDRLRAEKKDYAASTEEENESEELDDKGTKKKTFSFKSSGPNIVFESRISELEAQLTQCKLELRKAQDEAAFMKSQTKVTEPGQYASEANKQIEALQRERDELNETINHLQVLVNQLKDKEASATQKVKRSLDLIDQTHFDKNQLEMEVRRLKCELERMNDKQRESIQEAARRVSEAERRYTMQIERLNSDLAAQWDTANRLNLDLDRARRTEQELRRDLAQKNSVIDELKKELTTKTSNLQSEALTAGAERESLESELAACRLALERAERSARQETSRLQAEVASLRQRVDRADADLLHSRKENLRLSDNVASLEKELNLAKLAKNSSGGIETKKDDDLAAMIKDMDAKHVQSVAELEGMIQSQTQLMEKLKNECQNLTERLEDSTARHKADKNYLMAENDALLGRLGMIWQSCKDMMLTTEECNYLELEEGTHCRWRNSGISGGVPEELLDENETDWPAYALQHLTQPQHDTPYGATTKSEEEMAGLQNNIEYLNSKLEAPINFENQEWRDDGMVGNYEQDTREYERVEDSGGGQGNDMNGYDGAMTTGENYIQNGQKDPYGQNNEDPYSGHEQYRNDEMVYGEEGDYSNPRMYENQYDNQNGGYAEHPPNYGQQHGNYTDQENDYTAAQTAKYNQKPANNYVANNQDYSTQPEKYPDQQPGSYHQQPENYPNQVEEYRTDKERYISHPKETSGNLNHQSSGNYPNHVKQSGEYTSQPAGYKVQPGNYPSQVRDYRTNQEGYSPQLNEQVKGQIGKYSHQPGNDYPAHHSEYTKQGSYAEEPNNYSNQGQEIRTDQEEYNSQPTEPVKRQAANFSQQPSGNYTSDRNGYSSQSNEYSAQSRNYKEQPNNYPPQAYDYNMEHEGYASQPDYKSQEGKQSYNYPNQTDSYKNQPGNYSPQNSENYAAPSDHYTAHDNYDPRQASGYSEQPTGYTPTSRNYSPQNGDYIKHQPEYLAQEPEDYSEQNVEFHSSQPPSEYPVQSEYKSPEPQGIKMPNEQTEETRRHTLAPSPKDYPVQQETYSQEDQLNPTIPTSYSEPKEQYSSKPSDSYAAETNDFSDQPKVEREEANSYQEKSASSYQEFQDQPADYNMQMNEYENPAQCDKPSVDQTLPMVQTESSQKPDFAVKAKEEELKIYSEPPVIRAENSETQKRIEEPNKLPEERTRSYVPSPEPSDTRQSPPMKQQPSQMNKQQVLQHTKQMSLPPKQQGPPPTKQLIPPLPKQPGAPKQQPPQAKPGQPAKQQAPQTKQQPPSQTKPLPGQANKQSNPSTKQSAPPSK